MKRFAAAILLKDGKILLGKRSGGRDFYPNVWDFIGGHCGEDESFAAAMLREIQEEIAVLPIDYELFTAVDKMPDFVLQVFIVKSWLGEIRNVAPDENEKIEWFSFGEAAKLDFPDAEYFQVLESVKKLYGQAETRL